MRSSLRASLAVALAISGALTACSSQGGALPHQGASANGHPTAQVQINIKVPQRTSASRKPNYVSSGTASANVSVTDSQDNVTKAAFACSASVCSGTLAAPVGADTFGITLVDSAGTVLSQGSTTATIVANTANSVNVTFEGVVKSLTVTVWNNTFTTGVSSSLGVVVTGSDADRYQIIGAQPYLVPITLSLTDTSGTTSLSAAQIKTPEDPVQLSYNGGAGFTGATISASSGSVSSAPADITVSGSGLVTSLQGYKQIALVGDASTAASQVNPYFGMTTGPDGRLWVSFEGAQQSGLYAVNVTTGAATFYPTAKTSPGAIGVVNGHVAAIDEDHNDGGYGDLVLYNTDGTLATRYPGGVAVGSDGIFQGPDGNVYVTRGNAIFQFVISTNVWNTLQVPVTTCNVPFTPYTLGSDGNLYNACDATDLVKFTFASTSFSRVSDGANAAADAMMSEPALGSDNNLYTVHALADPTTHTSLGTAVGVSSGTGGSNTMYTYPSGLSYPQAIVAAPGKMAFFASDGNKNDANVLELFDQTAHTFSEYVDPSSQGAYARIRTTIRNASGVPVGIAWAETPSAIGVYVP